MPLLYEQQNTSYLLKAKLKRPLTEQEIRRLRNSRPLMEQKANIQIHKIMTTPQEILIYFSPAKTQKFIVISMSIITAIALIASAIGLPIASWFLTHPEIPTGPFGLPSYFWIAVGVAIPIFALIGLVIAMKR